MEPVATEIALEDVELPADICLPDGARRLVLFAHGSGSSRRSPRNRLVAAVLNEAAIGTILIDLLTEEEELYDRQTGKLRFDISLLSCRLASITDWIGNQSHLNELGFGYFGASTGAAAALTAAADRPDIVGAVVSRGGRPDLAGAALNRVLAPILFIVGGEDTVVLELNRSAMAKLPLKTEREIQIVAGAGHLFEEPGALDTVATLARDWFKQHLSERLSGHRA